MNDKKCLKCHISVVGLAEIFCEDCKKELNAADQALDQLDKDVQEYIEIHPESLKPIIDDHWNKPRSIQEIIQLQDSMKPDYGGRLNKQYVKTQEPPELRTDPPTAPSSWLNPDEEKRALKKIVEVQELKNLLRWMQANPAKLGGGAGILVLVTTFVTKFAGCL